MVALRTAFLRLSAGQHVIVATILAAAVALLVYWASQQMPMSLVAKNAELRATEGQLAAKTQNTAPQPLANFTQTLPQSAAHEDVVRDIGRSAQKLGFHIASLAIQKQPATANELGSIQFTIAAKAEYQGTKALLAELLARYPALALQSLSLRALPNELAKQEVRIVLALFVKD